MFLLFLLLFTAPAEAKLRFAVWTPPGYKYSYFVPVREGETLEHAVGRYQGALNLNRNLRKNLLPHALGLPVGKVTDFQLEPAGPRAIIPANKFSDMLSPQRYIDTPGKPLRKRNIRIYALPLAGAELGLNQEEAEEARQAIRKNFDLYVGIGGDDISPKLYGRQRHGARGDISYARDRPEMLLQKEFVSEEGTGFMANICRSHQMMGVPCPLVQDIPTAFGIGIHQKGIHKIKLFPEESEHLAKIFPGREEMWVNSLHHQSIDLPPEGNELLRVVATDLHGVVEAVELRNGKGIGVQFHPELMHKKVLDPFFDYLAAQARLAYARRIHATGTVCPVSFARVAAPK